MGLYRGQDMGGRRRLTAACLEILEGGSPSEIYDILPHIRILRSDSFLEPLLRLLTSAEPDRQRAALAALGSLGAADSAAAVCELLAAGPAPEVEEAAIRALGDIGADEGVETLVQVLQVHQGAETRAWAVASLGQLAQQGSQRAESELVVLFGHADPELRAQAASELAIAYWHRPRDVRSDTLEGLFGLAADHSAAVQQAALSALTNLADLGSLRARAFLEDGGS